MLQNGRLFSSSDTSKVDEATHRVDVVVADTRDDRDVLAERRPDPVDYEAVQVEDLG